ncbi:MAG: Rv0340 family IniB-related protein [Mycobacterium sp.]
MANELLDFVMALVRDPEAAAQYASDPAQAIAAANLTDVTSVDVNNLIPMVSDSLSMAVPAFGTDAAVDAAVDSNVWTSGAATAAFDAFAPLAPSDVTAQFPDVGGVIDAAGTSAPDLVSGITDLDPDVGTPLFDESSLLNDVDIDALGAAESAPWEHTGTDPQPLDQGHSGFDVFD